MLSLICFAESQKSRLQWDWLKCSW